MLSEHPYGASHESNDEQDGRYFDLRYLCDEAINAAAFTSYELPKAHASNVKRSATIDAARREVVAQ